jgi:hypothetical protein
MQQNWLAGLPNLVNGEYIGDVVYDSVQFSSTHTTSTSLFTVPIGGSGNGVTNKTPFHTNMEQVGKLPNNEIFKVWGLGMWLASTYDAYNFGLYDTDAAAYVTVLGKLLEGYVKVKIMNKDYRTFPISFLTSFRVKPVSAVASKCVYTIQNPLCRQYGYFPLSAPLDIGGGQNFGVDITLATAMAAVGSGENPFMLYFGFWGVRSRPIQ